VNGLPIEPEAWETNAPAPFLRVGDVGVTSLSAEMIR
jgi:hypothetical protein